MINILSTAIVNVADLSKVIAVSIVAGAGVVGAFGYVLLGVSRYQTVRHRSGRAQYIALIGVAGAVCVGAVALGLIALAHK